MPLSPVSLSLQSKELVKAYPPFVNFFEMSKDTIVRCEKQKPRFHAFLKVWPLLLFCRRLFAWLEDVHADETFKEFAKRKIMKTGRIMTLLHSNTTNIAVSISPRSLYIIPVTQSTPLHKTRVLVTCLELLLLLQSSSISVFTSAWATGLQFVLPSKFWSCCWWSACSANLCFSSLCAD